MANIINEYCIDNPNIMKYWDKEKNDALGIYPDKITTGSSKDAYFKCPDCNYEWCGRISNRIKSGCPCCTGRVVVKGYNDLETKFPEIAAEWDYEANAPLTPDQVHYNADKKAAFICSKCGYKWETRISRRQQCGCPACAGRVVVPGFNDLATTRPDIAAEWDYEKNGDLLPTNVTAGCGKDAWFICPSGHSYKARIGHRKEGQGCPICAKSQQTSMAEHSIYYYLRQVYTDVTNKNTDFLDNGMELDLYIPSCKIAIEYDGSPWHGEDEVQREHKKYLRCKELGIYLIRVKEKIVDESVAVADKIYITQDIRNRKNLNKTIADTIRIVDEINGVNYKSKNPFEVRPGIIVDTLKNESGIKNEYVVAIKENSFAEQYPEIAKQWDYKLNGNLKPEMMSKSCRTPVKWICRECGKSFESPASNIIKTGTDCEACRRRKRHTVDSWGNIINQYDMDGNLIKTWNDTTDILKAFGTRIYQLVDAILGINEDMCGYKFRCISKKTGKPYTSSVVVKMDENHNIVERYKDIIDAAEKMNVNYTNIYNAIAGRGRNTSYGYIWAYEQDLDQ